MTAKWTTLLIGAAIFAIVAATFAVNARNDFVRYDDYDYIVLNGHLESGLTPRSVKWAFASAGYADNWHPLTWLSHALDVSLADAVGLDWREESNDKGLVARTDGGLAVLSHLENVVLHAANAVLLYLLILSLSAKEGVRCAGCEALAAIFALLWALHPLRVEVVAWASERKELLCVLFMLLALIAHVSSRRTLSFLLFAFSLLAKPVAVTLPVLVFAVDFICLRRTFAAALRNAVPGAFLAAGACGLTLASQVTPLDAGRALGFGMRLLCAVEAPIVYLWQTACPMGLSIGYNLPQGTSWPICAAGILLLVAMSAVLIACLRSGNRWIGLGALAIIWSYVGLLPMIGIVKVGYQPHSDRYTYWVGCGLAVCGAIAAGWLRPRWERYRKEASICATVLLAACAAGSVRQSLVWKDTAALFGRAVERTRDAFYAKCLADELATQGVPGLAKAEALLRDVFQENRTPAMRGVLALHLAAFGRDCTEARLLAGYTLEESPSDKWATAAMAFADFRERRYRSAYANMRRACDLGFRATIPAVDLEGWRVRAEKEDK